MTHASKSLTGMPPVVEVQGEEEDGGGEVETEDTDNSIREFRDEENAMVRRAEAFKGMGKKMVAEGTPERRKRVRKPLGTVN